MPLPSGSRLGTYEIRALIGSGGMGEVYEAYDARLRRSVAIKVLPHGFTASPQQRERFEREAYALAALSHPNIVTIHAVEQVDGVDLLVMELVDGRPLRDLIPRSGMPFDDLLRIAIQLATAMSAAHAKGVTHRDLKPANILVAGDTHVKVLDFGIAKLADVARDAAATADSATRLQAGATAAGEIVGTVDYMSPEQAEGKPVDSRSDLFSLGVVLYEMATGERPFKGDSTVGILSAILRETPPAITDRRPDLPADLDRIIRRCLQKDPSRRLQTAIDLRNELEQLRAPATVPMPPVRSAMPTRRGLAAAAITLLLIGMGAWWMTRGERSSGSAIIDSVAVLPFVNASGNPDADYLSAGVTETLTNSLSQVRGVRVVPRTLAAQYANRVIDPRQVGRELRVRAVVTGQVRQRGDQLQVQAELVDVESVDQLWGDHFDRPLSEALAIQTALARAIATTLRRQLSDEDEDGLSAGTSDPLAYQLYLKGQDAFRKRRLDSLVRASEFFEQAIARDATYAQAYVGLSRALGTRANLNGMAPSEGYPKAIEAARKAIALDDSSAEAHAALAVAVLHYEWNWTEAEREYARARELGPENADVHFLYAGFFLRYTSRNAEALDELGRAEALDPLTPAIPAHIAMIQTQSRRYDEAIAAGKRALLLEPDSGLSHRALAAAYRMKGMTVESIAESRRLVELKDPSGVVFLAQAYAAAGQKAEAQQILRTILTSARVSTVGVAGVYAALGMPSEAFSWLERAYRERDPVMVGIGTAPEFENLRSDPRFGDLLRRLGIPRDPAGGA